LGNQELLQEYKDQVMHPRSLPSSKGLVVNGDSD